MTTEGNQKQGFKVLNLGAPGSGKTTVIGTLVDCGLDVFHLMTEPGHGALSKLTPEQRSKIHYAYVPGMAPRISDLLTKAKTINTMSFQALTNLKDASKEKYQELIQILTMLDNFTDQHGKEWGAVDDWGPDRALVLDSLSGLNLACLKSVAGSKPVPNMSEWGMAAGMEEDLINKLCLGCKCHFILTAHIERETDEVLGSTRIMPGALGRKLPPKIGRYFDEVLLSRYNSNGTFTWSTADAQSDLKGRFLPIGQSSLPQSFKPIYEAWLATQS